MRAIVELLARVMTVGVETLKITVAMSALSASAREEKKVTHNGDRC